MTKKKFGKLNLSLVPLFFLIFTSCIFSNQKDFYKKAVSFSKEKKYKKALKLFDQVIYLNIENNISLKSAKNAGEISLYQFKDYKKAIKYYEIIKTYSNSQNEITSSQNIIADIYFNHLQDYKKAIFSYEKLINITNNTKEKFKYKIRVSKSYYHLGELKQAEVEIKSVLEKNLYGDEKYEAKQFYTVVLIANEKIDEAINILTNLISIYPLKAKKDNLHLQLSLFYEEKEDFARAIEILDESEFSIEEENLISDRIKKLKVRKSLLPGRKKFKK